MQLMEMSYRRKIRLRTALVLTEWIFGLVMG